LARVDHKAHDDRSSFAVGGKTVALCAAWVVSFYVYLIYLPSYLSKLTGASAATALWANTAGLATMMVTIPFAGLLSDRIGRRPPLLVATVLAIVVPFPIFCLLAVWHGLRLPNPCRRRGLIPPEMFLGSAEKGRFFVPA